MQTANGTALKEWAAVCAALAAGRQSILLRKGGIAEGPGGFRIERPEFWLYPTQFHQQPDQLSPEGQLALSSVADAAPPPARLRISLYAVVLAVKYVLDPVRLAEVRDLHILSDAAVRQRFEYRRPGLFVAAVDVFQAPTPFDLAELPRFAGCHSWVELDSPLPTAGLTPLHPELGAEAARRLAGWPD
ncbi:MAG: DUF1802 family protein [Planctomyces sp.]|nr:DUF1802 family protein [Planctomyces sp.]